jgi:flagellar protein FliS
MTTGVAAYQQNSIDTASPLRLVVMLYDGLLASLDKVDQSLAESPQGIEAAHHELMRSQAIIEELMSSLNAGAGPVARSLAALYEYSHRQLVEANLLKQFGPAQPVRTIFEDLREAWDMIANQYHEQLA